MEIMVSGSKPELEIFKKREDRTFAFLSGLPRSGSTLLSSILNQNPAIHSGANSPMCGMMWNLEQSILASEQFNAYPKINVLHPMIYNLLDSYYMDRNELLIIDKSREWSMPQHFELLTKILPYEPKIILCVRSIVEILASFINLVHINPSNVSFIDKEIEIRQDFHFYKHPDEIRCDSLMRPKGPIDNALYGIAFACQPEYSKYFHFVEYVDLVNDTENTINGVYNFLGLECFEHQYENIENKFHERDETYGLYGMHDIKRKIVPSSINIAEVLPPYVLQKYSYIEFWRNYE